MEMTPLSERQLDALREVSNVGMGHAATALSQLTGRTVYLNVPRLTLVETHDMAAYLGGAQRVVVGIYLRMLGNAQGNILMVFPFENAGKILETLLPQQRSGGKPLSELQCSALKEVGNILASAYLNAFGDMLHMTLIPSVPMLSIDAADIVVAHALADFGEVSRTTMLLETEFYTSEERISSQFFLLPNPSSLNVILTSLGIDGP